MVPPRDDTLVIPTPPSFAVASGTVDDDPSNSAIHLRRAQFIESPSKRRAISSTTSAHHDPCIDRLTPSSTSSRQATTVDSPSVHRGCPSPLAPVELYPPQHNAEGSSPNNQIRDGTFGSLRSVGGITKVKELPTRRRSIFGYLIRCMPRLTDETGVYTVPSSYGFGSTS